MPSSSIKEGKNLRRAASLSAISQSRGNQGFISGHQEFVGSEVVRILTLMVFLFSPRLGIIDTRECRSDMLFDCS